MNRNSSLDDFINYLENRIDKVEDLIQFDLAGYSYHAKESSRFSPVFFRKND